MTARLGGLSWIALATIAGFFGLMIIAHSLMHAGINKRIDDLRAEIAAVSVDVDSVKTDVGDLKADMAVVLAVLERIERRQIADDGRQPSPAGTTLAKPLPVSSGDSVSDCTADIALPD